MVLHFMFIVFPIMRFRQAILSIAASFADPVPQEILWIRQAQTDPANFEPLYRKYYKQVFVFIAQRVENKDHAADLTQQVFIKAITKISTWQDKGHPFSAWLYRIALHEIGMAWRKDQVIRVVRLDDLPHAPGAEEVSFINEDHYLYKAMHQLNPDELALIELRFFEKKGFADIAAICDTSEANIKNKVYRILKKLRKYIPR